MNHLTLRGVSFIRDRIHLSWISQLKLINHRPGPSFVFIMAPKSITTQPSHRPRKRAAPSTSKKTTPKESSTPASQSNTMASSTTSPALPPVYFWRQTEPEGGCFSQWYHCAFFDPEDPSVVYPTAEQYVSFSLWHLNFYHDHIISPFVLNEPPCLRKGISISLTSLNIQTFPPPTPLPSCLLLYRLS